MRLEAQALVAHPDWSNQKFADNHFVIVGPESDPAGVRSVPTPAEAFRRRLFTNGSYTKVVASTTITVQ